VSKAKGNSKAKKILALLAKGETIKNIAKALKCSEAYVYYVRWESKKKKAVMPERSSDPKVQAAEKKYVKKVNKLFDATTVTKKEIDALFKPMRDLVNHPPHYKSGGIETIDFIEAKDLNYRLGNVIKYVSRAGKKLDSDPVQDLEKAAFYLNREIELRKGA
jgi:hypothetical protein